MQLTKSNVKILTLFFFLSSIPSHITQKAYGVYKQFTQRTTALLSEIFLFLVRGACEPRSASYSPKHTSWSLSDTSFCAHLHAQLENSRWYEDVRRIERLLYYWRYLFTGLELYVRYDRWVMDPNTHRNHFPIRLLCVLIHVLVTRKLQVVDGRCTSWMTALLSEMSTFCVRAKCEMQMVSYGSKNASKFLSYKPRTYTYNVKTTCHIWLLLMSNDCSTIGDILCVV